MKLKIYIMHSEKIDYKSILYKPLLESNIGRDNILILPMSKRFESTYIKDLLKDSDIVICDLTKFNFLANIELKTAMKLNKKICYFINKNDKKLNKFKSLNPIIYENKEDFSNKVKAYLDSLNKKEILLNRENIYSLGKIVK